MVSSSIKRSPPSPHDEIGPGLSTRPPRLEWDDASGLVVLGGPMNVDEVDRYPFLRQEVDWIGQALERDLPVLGICLGAQLAAKTLAAMDTLGQHVLQRFAGQCRNR